MLVCVSACVCVCVCVCVSITVFWIIYSTCCVRVVLALCVCGVGCVWGVAWCVCVVCGAGVVWWFCVCVCLCVREMCVPMEMMGRAHGLPEVRTELPGPPFSTPSHRLMLTHLHTRTHTHTHTHTNNLTV